MTYGDVFLRAEREYSAYNFEHADTAMLSRHFTDAEGECAALLERKLALPAYDQCIKASHLFNLLDASGVISVTERASYIGRVRALAKGCCEAWVARGSGVRIFQRTTPVDAAAAATREEVLKSAGIALKARCNPVLGICWSEAQRPRS